MAGTLKPTGVGAEGSWIINDFNFVRGKCLLFDGSNTTDYAGGYWYDASNPENFLDITFPQTVNIWCLGDLDDPTYAGMFAVKKWDGNAFTPISIQQIDRVQNGSEWTKCFSLIPAGRYRFSIGNIIRGTTGRIDKEWFIEKTNSNVQILSGGM